MQEFNGHTDPHQIERPEEPSTPDPTCFNCDYDLSGTDPDSLCPECGIPAEFTFGRGPLSTVESDVLVNIARGFSNAMAGILLYVIVSFASIIASFVVSMMTIQQIQPGQTPTFSRLFYLVNFASSILTTLAALIFFIGWWRITTPLDGLPDALNRSDWRRIIRITIPIQITGSVLGLAWNAYTFIAMPNSSLQGFQPSLQGWGLLFTILTILLGLVMIANLVVFWIFQMLYIRWFARMALNKPMEKRAKHLIWSGPLMVIIGSMCLMIGPLVFAVLYYRMHYNLRRDVMIISASSSAS